MKRIKLIFFLFAMAIGVISCGKQSSEFESAPREEHSVESDSDNVLDISDNDKSLSSQTSNLVDDIKQYSLGEYIHDDCTYSIMCEIANDIAGMRVEVYAKNGELVETWVLSDNDMNYFDDLFENPENHEERFYIGGDSVGAYLLYNKQLYYIDYLTEEIFRFLDRPVLALYVYDHNHFLTKYDDNMTVYVTYDTLTNIVLESEASNEEMKHMFDDVYVEPIHRYSYASENGRAREYLLDNLLPEGEYVRQIGHKAQDSILYLFTDYNVFRYDTETGLVEQLKGEVPGVSYFFEFLEEELVLKECWYYGIRFGQEAYIGYSGRVLARIRYDGDEIEKVFS